MVWKQKKSRMKRDLFSSNQTTSYKEGKEQSVLSVGPNYLADPCMYGRVEEEGYRSLIFAQQRESEFCIQRKLQRKSDVFRAQARCPDRSRGSGNNGPDNSDDSNNRRDGLVMTMRIMTN